MTGRQRCGEAKRPPPTRGPCGALPPGRRIATPHAHGIEAGRTSRRVRDCAFPHSTRSFRARAVMPRKEAVLRGSESPLHAATRVDTRRQQAGAAPRRALAIKERPNAVRHGGATGGGKTDCLAGAAAGERRCPAASGRAGAPPPPAARMISTTELAAAAAKQIGPLWEGSR